MARLLAIDGAHPHCAEGAQLDAIYVARQTASSLSTPFGGEQHSGRIVSLSRHSNSLGQCRRTGPVAVLTGY